jgi:iron complex outermembrane receptor protein
MAGAAFAQEPVAAPPAPASAPNASQTAPAPDAPSAEAGEEIIVTARRVSESLQDVPASITAFTEETLANAGIETTEDFVQLTPGVTIVSGTAEVGDPQINIRGLNGARDAEPSVALVVDGVLKTNVSSLNQQQGDLTQVEILKGPQGALYGRNAAAGAIILTTRKPGDELEGRFRASVAEDDSYEGFASISTPIGEGAGLLLSADYRRTDGQFRNTGPTAARGTYLDRYENWNINGRLVLEPSDALEIDVKARYGRIDAGAIVFNAAFALPNFAALNPFFYEDVNRHEFAFQPNITPDNDQRTIDASLKLDYDLENGMTITAWAAFSDINQDFVADGTSGAFGFFNADAPCRASVAQLNASGFQLPPPQSLGQVPESNLFVPNGSLLGPYSPTLCDGTQYQVRNQRDVSAELRIASDPDASLRWLAGVYYLDLDRQVGVNLGIDRGNGVIKQLFTTDARNPTEQLVHDDFDTRVYAVFGSIDADLGETLTASLALRYDNERRKVRNLVPTTARTQYIDFTGANRGGAPLNPGLLFGPINPQSATFDQIEPKISLTWEPTARATLFANYGKGFKPGGFNNQGSRATIELNFPDALFPNLTIQDRFDEETSDAFEAGFKASLLDGLLNLEGAGYYTRVKDLQFFEFFVGTFGLLRVVSNIDRVDIKGVEIGANVRPVEGWSIFGAFNLTDSEIKRNSARPDTVGNKSPYTSDYTVNLGTQLELPLTDSLEFLVRADARIVGPTWFSTVQDQERPTLFTALLPLAGLPAALGTARYDRTERDTFTTVNLRAGIEGQGWSLTAFANNLLDEKYLEEVIPAPEFGGAFISPAARRRVGVELSYRF